VSGPKQDDLFKAYARLCGDDTPMVRRQAASVLGEVASVVPQESMLAELVEVFEKLCRDEQESVRILAISNCVALGRLKRGAEWQAQIFPVVESCAQDKSWRVRYVMAEHVHTLCEVFHTKATHIVPLYLQLLQDQEVEVRTIAAARIAGVSKVKPDKDFLETLIPVMEKLTAPRERSHHVRAALAGAVLSLSPVFGPSLTVDYLVNIFLHLIKDESADVRLKLIGTLGELSAVMGIDVLSQSLLPCIKELGRDRQWRVRLMVIDSMPSLAKYLGPAKFTEELSGLFVAWLEDPVCSVRDAIAVNFRRLYVELGAVADRVVRDPPRPAAAGAAGARQLPLPHLGRAVRRPARGGGRPGALGEAPRAAGCEVGGRPRAERLLQHGEGNSGHAALCGQDEPRRHGGPP
ncbi:unnamed protein product, partial [Prorocentrum cordatum]